MGVESIKNGVCEYNLDSWEHFGALMTGALAKFPTLLYRGQADATWKIESTLDRLEHRFPEKPNYSSANPKTFHCPPVARDVHLEAFKEAARGKRGAHPGDLCEDEWWALAQHHGLATPLVDWTYSPFVALFFAFEEAAVACGDMKVQTAEKRAVYAVPFHLITANGTKKHPAPTVFSPRREITHRLGSQSGVFMKMPRGTDLETSVRARFENETTGSDSLPCARPILIKIIIRNAERTDCLKWLNKMNINRMSLFPELDGAAKYINALWELDFDTALGYLPDGVTGKGPKRTQAEKGHR